MKKYSEHNMDEHLFLNHDKFQSLDVKGDWQKVRERMGFESVRSLPGEEKERKVRWVWAAAAIMILLLGIGFLGRSLLFTPRIMLSETSGESQKEIRFADGSTVTLNMNSVITYPERFGRNTRNVTFSGEGFFEVARDPGRPFIINISDRATVEVLGTSFNINAFNPNDSIMVHVVDGRVSFFTGGPSPEEAILRKNEHALLKAGRISQVGTTNQNFLSWRTGILQFDQEPLNRVLQELGRFYNREFIPEGVNSEEILFTTTIDNQDLESVLEELSLVLGLEYTLEEERVILFRPDQ